MAKPPWWDDKAAPNKQELSKLVQTGWTALIQDKTIGKKIIIPAQGSDSGVVQGNSLNILQVSAPNEFAQQLQLVLGSPQLVSQYQFPGSIVPVDGSVINSTGERDNYGFLSPPSALNNISWMQAIAVVEWGIGGVQYKAEVDFLNGLCINLVAAWVRVSAFIDAINTAGTVVDGGGYVFSAFIGPGYPKANNAQRTFYVGGMKNVASTTPPRAGWPLVGYNGQPNPEDPPLNGAVNVYPVPYFAKLASVIAFRSDTFPYTSSWDLDLVFFRDVRSSEPMGNYNFTQSNREPARIPNGAMYFSLHNNLGNPVTSPAQVIFDLAI
jgi:hypothetical protein